MGVQGLSLPSTPRFNHPTDCLQLRAPKFLLSLFSPLFLSLSLCLFSRFCFPVVVFMFSLSLSRADRTQSALESTSAGVNAFYIGFGWRERRLVFCEKNRASPVLHKKKEGKKNGRERKRMEYGLEETIHFGESLSRIRGSRIKGERHIEF